MTRFFLTEEGEGKERMQPNDHKGQHSHFQLGPEFPTGSENSSPKFVYMPIINISNWFLTDLQQFNTTTRFSVMGVSVVVKSARQDP